MTAARDYAFSGHRAVKGWLDGTSAKVIYGVGTWQIDEGVTGAVAEIGVHEGRLFLLLDLLRRPEEVALAIDLFEDQHLNLDSSGRGDRTAFLDNVSRVVGDTKHLHLIQRSSTDVKPTEVLDAVGSVRILSVDGGHSARITLNDLRLADAILEPKGVTILDDVFNERWPGVVSGLTAYMTDTAGGLVPAVISPNKVFLTRPGMADRYRGLVRAMRPRLFLADGELFDHPVVIVEPEAGGGRGMLRNTYRRLTALPVVGPTVRNLREARRCVP